MVFGCQKILFDLCQFKFEEFPNNESDRIVVVSYFGKSVYDVHAQKSPCFKTLSGSFNDNKGSYLPNIDGCYDASNNVVHLQLRGVLDVHNLVSVINNLPSQSLEKGYLTAWADLNHGYAKGLLFLLSVSHIMVLCHPVPTFDLGYIQLFKALDLVRSKLTDKMSILLSEVQDLSKDWIENCRPCSPRMLFRFDSCPRRVKDVKRLCHALEDQIYHILRKSKVICNISAKSLFSVPANQEFVFVESNTTRPGNMINTMLNNIVANCFHDGHVGLHNRASSDRLSLDYQILRTRHEHSFDQFLSAHIDLALTKGFDDNVGRHLVPASFTLPTLWQLLEIAQRTYTVLLDETRADEELSDSLKHHLDIDLKFSEARCAKVLPLALATYQENSPFHYTREYHEGKLAQAMTVLAIHGRGAMVELYVSRLAAECLKYWQNGRQMCQVPSLTGHPCTNAMHASTDQSEQGPDTAGLEVKEHSSGVRYFSSCNCGRQQMARSDPYTLKSANLEFYSSVAEQCGCDHLDSFQFPVFQPSVKDFKPAQVGGTHKMELSEKRGEQEPTQETSGPGSDVNEGSTATRFSSHHTSDPRNADQDVVITLPTSTREDSATSEKGLVRQPSTTEYLPGMIHTESPAGLLPQFSSWSLVCLGPSSIYSHNLGLQDQPGLITSSSYLLPWDVIVKLNSVSTSVVVAKPSWPEVTDHGKAHGQMRVRKSKSDQSELVVKIFVGVEYECPRGHRFMMSGVDKVLRTTNSGQVKDTGHKVAQTDMPLYYPCPCRGNKPLVGQLMRLHVVTPKAPVKVTLNPRVQPAPGAPLFIASIQQPLPLSQSAYWVLRLPSQPAMPLMMSVEATDETSGYLFTWVIRDLSSLHKRYLHLCMEDFWPAVTALQTSVQIPLGNAA